MNDTTTELPVPRDFDAFERVMADIEASGRTLIRDEALRRLAAEFPTRKWDKKKVATYDNRRTRRRAELVVRRLSDV